MLRRERVYFLLLALASALVVYVLTVTVIGAVVALCIVGVAWLLHAVVMGYLRGNAVHVSPEQFPEVHRIAQEAAQRLGVSAPPQVWVLQTGRLQAELTRRFARRHYVIITNEVAELASEPAPAPDALRFLLAHEFVRAHRQLPLWGGLLAAGRLVPFVGAAYFRASTTTCDRIAAAAVPEGAHAGLKVIAAGPDLFHHADADALTRQGNSGGFWRWAHSILSRHPHVVRRFTSVSEIASGTPRTGLPKVATGGWERPIAAILLVAAPVLAAVTLSTVQPRINDAFSDGWDKAGVADAIEELEESSAVGCEPGYTLEPDGYCYPELE